MLRAASQSKSVFVCRISTSPTGPLNVWGSGYDVPSFRRQTRRTCNPDDVAASPINSTTQEEHFCRFWAGQQKATELAEYDEYAIQLIGLASILKNYPRECWGGVNNGLYAQAAGATKSETTRIDETPPSTRLYAKAWVDNRAVRATQL
jgi:hypothetical protein